MNQYWIFLLRFLVHALMLSCITPKGFHCVPCINSWPCIDPLLPNIGAMLETIIVKCFKNILQFGKKVIRLFHIDNYFLVWWNFILNFIIYLYAGCPCLLSTKCGCKRSSLTPERMWSPIFGMACSAWPCMSSCVWWRSIREVVSSVLLVAVHLQGKDYQVTVCTIFLPS